MTTEFAAAHVRLAASADIDRMARIYVDAWRETYPSILPRSRLLAMSYARSAHMFRCMVSPMHPVNPVFVSVDAKAGVVALASGGVNKDRGLRIEGREIGAEIFTLYVAPNHLDRGHGRALVKAMLNYFENIGNDAAVVWVLAHNPARFFYRGLGAQQIAEREDMTFGKRLRLEAYAWPKLS